MLVWPNSARVFSRDYDDDRLANRDDALKNDDHRVRDVRTVLSSEVNHSELMKAMTFNASFPSNVTV